MNGARPEEDPDEGVVTMFGDGDAELLGSRR